MQISLRRICMEELIGGQCSENYMVCQPLRSLPQRGGHQYAGSRIMDYHNPTSQRITWRRRIINGLTDVMRNCTSPSISRAGAAAAASVLLGSLLLALASWARFALFPRPLRRSSSRARCLRRRFASSSAPPLSACAPLCPTCVVSARRPAGDDRPLRAPSSEVVVPRRVPRALRFLPPAGARAALSVRSSPLPTHADLALSCPTRRHTPTLQCVDITSVSPSPLRTSEHLSNAVCSPATDIRPKFVYFNDQFSNIRTTAKQS